MTTLADVETTVYGWINSVMALGESLDGDGGPLIRTAHIGIMFTAVKHAEWGTEILSTDGLTQTVNNQADVTIKISCHGQHGHDAMQMASTLINSLKSTARWMDLWAIGGKGEVTPITDLSALETGAIQGRAQFQFTLHTCLTDNFTHDYFNSILINVTETNKGLVAVIHAHQQRDETMSTIITGALKSFPLSLDVPTAVYKPQSTNTVDLSVTAFVSSTGPLSGNLPFGAGRIRFYTDLLTVSNDWGTTSSAYAAARDFFSQQGRAVTMAIGQAFSTAQKGYMTTGTCGAVSAFNSVTAGSFSIAIDGVSQNISALNFTTDTTLALIATRIQAAIRAIGTGGFLLAAVTVSGGQLVFTSGTSGGASSVSVLGATGAGTDISGATLLNGVTGTTQIGYTPTDIANELNLISEAARAAGRFVYAWDLDSTYRDTAAQQTAAAWAQANLAVMSITSNSPLAYDPSTTTDVGSVISGLGQYRVYLTWMAPTQLGYYPGMATFAQMLGTNYSAVNAHRTAKFMDLTGLPTAPIDTTQLSVLQSKGYDVLTLMSGGARTLREGDTSSSPKWYLDELIDLDNFSQESQTEVFNTFVRNKVVGLNAVGQAKMQDALTTIAEKYVFNGCFSARPVTDVTTKAGYRIDPAYTITQTPLNLLTTAQRSARQGGVMTINVNLTGAMHSIAININAYS